MIEFAPKIRISNLPGELNVEWESAKGLQLNAEQSLILLSTKQRIRSIILADNLEVSNRRRRIEYARHETRHDEQKEKKKRKSTTRRI